MTALYVILVVLLLLATYCAVMAALHGKAASAWLSATAAVYIHGEGEESELARQRAVDLSSRAARYDITKRWSNR